MNTDCGKWYTNSSHFEQRGRHCERCEAIPDCIFEATKKSLIEEEGDCFAPLTMTGLSSRRRRDLHSRILIADPSFVGMTSPAFVSFVPFVSLWFKTKSSHSYTQNSC